VNIGPGAQLDFRKGLFLLLLAPEFYLPMRQLAAGYHDRANGISAADALTPLLEEKIEVASSSNAPLSAAPSLRIANIAFKYEEASKPIFAELSTELEAGECLVLRGDSGTRKSTLLKLLAGLLTPTEGSVFYNNLA